MKRFNFILNGKKLPVTAKNRFFAVLNILKTFPKNGDLKISQLQLTEI